MAIFDRFRRNQKSVLPDEVQQYYQSEKRQRTGVAALLAVLALIITVAVASALFFGGRYVYRQINNSDTQTTQQAENKDKTPEQTSSKSTQGSNQGQSGQTSPSTPKPAPTPSTPQTPSNTNTPRLGDEPAPLPRTGDEGL